MNGIELEFTDGTVPTHGRHSLLAVIGECGKDEMEMLDTAIDRYGFQAVKNDMIFFCMDFPEFMLQGVLLERTCRGRDFEKYIGDNFSRKLTNMLTEEIYRKNETYDGMTYHDWHKASRDMFICPRCEFWRRATVRPIKKCRTAEELRELFASDSAYDGLVGTFVREQLSKFKRKITRRETSWICSRQG